MTEDEETEVWALEEELSPTFLYKYRAELVAISGCALYPGAL